MHPGFLLQLAFKVSAHREFILRKQIPNVFTRRCCCGMQHPEPRVCLAGLTSTESKRARSGEGSPVLGRWRQEIRNLGYSSAT